MYHALNAFFKSMDLKDKIGIRDVERMAHLHRAEKGNVVEYKLQLDATKDGRNMRLGFTSRIHKTSGLDSAPTEGLLVDSFDPQPGPDEKYDSLIVEANAHNPSRPLRVGDVIKEVNGKRDPNEAYRELCKPQPLVITFLPIAPRLHVVLPKDRRLYQI